VSGNYRVLYRFTGGADGADPDGNLFKVGGTLYGTTSDGGANNNGTVFKVKAAGKEPLFHSFSLIDSALSEAGLTEVGGTLFGTASIGGIGDAGTVFKATTSGDERAVYRFKGNNGPDAASPKAGLINIGNTLYGTTDFGGAYGQGTVFKVTTSGKEAVIHSFGNGADGENPLAPLLDVGGALYGTTYHGGQFHSGTVFKVTISGRESVLYSFPKTPIDRGSGAHSNGAYPAAGLVYVGGALYGTTKYGGASGDGTVFRITTSGKESVLYGFGGRPDGASPVAGLIDVGGTLYGTTSSGSTSTLFYGTVFRITTAGQERVLHAFSGGTDGANPRAALTDVGGTLYGTTYQGGGSGCEGYGCGTVFSIEL